jgi:hypothetical protein
VTDPLGPTVTVEFGTVYGGEIVVNIPIAEEVPNPPETKEGGAVPVRETEVEPFVYGAEIVGDDRLVPTETLEYVDKPMDPVGVVELDKLSEVELGAEDENPPETAELLGPVPVAPAKEVVLYVGYGAVLDEKDKDVPPETEDCDTPVLRLPVA